MDNSDSEHFPNQQNQTEVILTNIARYKSQLDDVNQALESASEEDKNQLQELQLNLVTILELTLNQLDQVQTQVMPVQGEEKKANDLKKQSLDDIFDEEFKRFKSEIAELDGIKEETQENEPSLEEEKEDSCKIKNIHESLKDLEGQNVRVPFKERWGGFSYHNAIVFSTVHHEDQPINIENPEIVVLFSQPTSLSMLPCRFFLEGRCNFPENECKYSHGKKVPFSEVKEYQEPDLDAIVSGTKVLALHEGQDLWHPGSVEDVLENRAGFSFNCSVCREVFETSLKSMVPLFADDDPMEKEGDSSATQLSNITDDVETTFIPNDLWLKNSINTKLGDWEKYTKGIGSKLMAQMGYVVGTGLGPKGEGKVDPVSAYVYPQGVSLDYCMHLRESSNGGCLLEVEKRLLAQQKKQEAKAKRQNDQLRTRTSVFDIINDKLGFKPAKDSDITETFSNAIDVSRTVLKKDSIKELNRKNFQLSSSIDKLKTEIVSLQKSRIRQGKDPATVKTIDENIKEKMRQLASLQQAEKQIEAEQVNRKNRQKFCSF